MSLTNMVENSRLKDIIKPILPKKHEFDINLGLGKKAFSKDYPLLAPNELSNKGDGKLVGIAFDYMARFIVANYIENNKEKVLENLVCLNAFDILETQLSAKELEDYQLWYIEAISMIKDYIMNISNNYSIIIPYALRLAKLEQIKRSYPLISDVKSVLNEDYDKNIELELDLQRNCEVFEKTFIKSSLVKKDSDVVFNPKFGMWSVKCLGADADIFIDGVLYDFKCTTIFGYRTKYIAQICGYYLLHKLTQITDNDELEEYAPLKKKEIRALAFYKSRFGVIEQFDVRKISEKQLQIVIEEAQVFINKYYKRALEFRKFMDEKLLKENNN